MAQIIAPEAVTQPLFITPPPTNVTRTAGVSTARVPRARFSREFYIVMLVLSILLIIAAITLFVGIRNQIAS